MIQLGTTSMPPLADMPAREFDDIFARISELHERAARISTVACDAADRLLGPIPEAGNTGHPVAVPNGLIAEALQRLDDLSAMLTRIDGHVTRLSAI